MLFKYKILFRFLTQICNFLYNLFQKAIFFKKKDEKHNL